MGAIAVPKIEIYTSHTCGYCHAAKRLLDKKGASYEEINVAFAPERRPEMVERAGGRRTVPQIFIDGKHVGGCDDLYELDFGGGLDGLLAS
ncbi:MAG: glutaredoxin 3 [Marivivens sp.]|jgi:glutaredoxin 3